MWCLFFVVLICRCIIWGMVWLKLCCLFVVGGVGGVWICVVLIGRCWSRGRCVWMRVVGCWWDVDVFGLIWWWRWLIWLLVVGVMRGRWGKFGCVV